MDHDKIIAAVGCSSKSKVFAPDKAAIVFKCSDCGEIGYILAESLVETGTAVCSDCDNDMEVYGVVILP